MQIEVKIVSEEDTNLNPRDRRVVHVETHSKRNDSFTVQKVDDVLEGDAVTFSVPTGGRLVINTPQTNEEIVYDVEQAAAIRSTRQLNDEGRADRVDMDALAKTKQDEADLAKKQADEAKERQAEVEKTEAQKAEAQKKLDAARQGQPAVTGTTPQTTGQTPSAKPTTPPANPAANTPNPSHPSTPAQTPPQQKK